VLASVAAAFFYLRVIVLMYMQEPETAEPGTARPGTSGLGATGEPFTVDDAVLPRIAIVIPAALILVLGVFPGLISDFLDAASVLRW
jgi:NADH:ubiquinone oxidoreductase subunit 2 (subunit N)